MLLLRPTPILLRRHTSRGPRATRGRTTPRCRAARPTPIPRTLPRTASRKDIGTTLKTRAWPALRASRLLAPHILLWSTRTAQRRAGTFPEVPRSEARARKTGLRAERTGEKSARSRGRAFHKVEDPITDDSGRHNVGGRVSEIDARLLG